MRPASLARERPLAVGAGCAAAGVLLAGPTVLAFFTGGYFPDAQAWAGLGAWLLVLGAAVAAWHPPEPAPAPGGGHPPEPAAAPGGGHPPEAAAAPGGGHPPEAISVAAGGRPPAAAPRRRLVTPARLAVGGLILLGAWTLASIAWAPIAGSAYHAGQLVFLYAGALAAGALLLRARGLGRAVEPALAAGTLIVIGYGIAGRLLPGALHFARSVSAQGRLEQPLTYWNAMGELAAIGFVLSCRLAGDARRAPWLRGAAAAGAVPLGLGLYLSFSRGALFACAAGLVALVVAAPRREQLETIGVCLLGALAASATAFPFPGVTSLRGPLAVRERQGVIVLVVVAAIVLAVVLAQRWLSARRRSMPLTLPRRSGLIAAAVICVGLAVAIWAGAHEASGRPLTGSTGRYVSLESNRYAYWGVALRAFGHEPIHGVGAGGWAVWWLRYRRIDDFAQDAHSLPLQTLAELGLVGALLLGAFFLGVGWAARVAQRLCPAAAAGPIAGFVAYAAHAPLDWDWQMPAVTLVAIVLAAQLLAQSDSAIRGASRAKIHTPSTQTAR